MKRTAMLVFLVCMLSMCVQAEEMGNVASVDLNRVQNEVGYQRLVFLDASDEVKAEIIKLRQALDQIMLESVREEDDSKIALLQARSQSINNKLNIIRNTMNMRNSDYRRALIRYINKRYSENYALVLDQQMFRNNDQVLVSDASKIVDLTNEIIQTLNQELP